MSEGEKLAVVWGEQKSLGPVHGGRRVVLSWKTGPAPTNEELIKKAGGYFGGRVESRGPFSAVVVAYED